MVRAVLLGLLLVFCLGLVGCDSAAPTQNADTKRPSRLKKPGK
jgi:hypothetical protein